MVLQCERARYRAIRDQCFDTILRQRIRETLFSGFEPLRAYVEEIRIREYETQIDLSHKPLFDVVDTVNLVELSMKVAGASWALRN
jgi:hypothetical protein